VKRFEIMELEVRGFTLTNLVFSFKCSSFWLLEVGEKLRSRLRFGVFRMIHEDLKRMGIAAGRATTAH
jgi:hypothetical protein